MINPKIILFYDLVLEKPRSKSEMAYFFDSTSKTVENTFNKFKANQDIIYSKKMGKYVLAGALPNFITVSFIVSVLKKNLKDNPFISDFILLFDSLENNLLETKKLSPSLIALLVQELN